jgi:hypothetical protein
MRVWASIMTERNRERSSHLKSYTIAFFIGLPLILVTIFLALLLIPMNVPHYLSVVLFFLLFSPVFIVFSYLLYRALVPVTGGMPLKGVKPWLLLYPFVVGFGFFWAFLSFIFETFAPTLSPEDRQITLPILIISAITIVLCTTRLRYPIARFINRLFETEPIEEEWEDARI